MEHTDEFWEGPWLFFEGIPNLLSMLSTRAWSFIVSLLAEEAATEEEPLSLLQFSNFGEDSKWISSEASKQESSIFSSIVGISLPSDVSAVLSTSDDL